MAGGTKCNFKHVAIRTKCGLLICGSAPPPIEESAAEVRAHQRSKSRLLGTRPPPGIMIRAPSNAVSSCGLLLGTASLASAVSLASSGEPMTLAVSVAAAEDTARSSANRVPTMGLATSTRRG